MAARQTKFTRFERTATSVIGYQLIEGKEIEAVKILTHYNINNDISIVVTSEFLDDILELINVNLTTDTSAPR